MKAILVIASLFVTLSSFAQVDESNMHSSFETEVLAYEPKMKPSLSEKNFKYGKMILDEVKSATERKIENFNVADYFNVLSAFLTLREEPNKIHQAYDKFVAAEGSCEYITSFEKNIRDSEKYDILMEKYLADLARCKSGSADKEIPFDLAAYCESGGYDQQLVEQMQAIELKDRKYRTMDYENNVEQQRQLDIENQRVVEKLYQSYKTYIGKSLVGEKYEHVMWAVIQHSNIDMMEEYLPIVHKAYKTGELQKAPFKMLIDRVYALKHGYQIFGSQMNVDLVDEVIRQRVMKTYGL